MSVMMIPVWTILFFVGQNTRNSRTSQNVKIRKLLETNIRLNINNTSTLSHRLTLMEYKSYIILHIVRGLLTNVSPSMTGR